MNYRKLFDMKGKISVVTGGLGLLGKEVVTGLAQLGSRVIVADINAEKMKQIKRGSTSVSRNVDFYCLDISDEKSILLLIKFIEKKFGKLDVWVNCAYPKTEDWGKSFSNIKLSSWKKNVDAHLNGYAMSSHMAAEYMKRREKGSIINFSSIYGIVGPDFSIYNGTKMTMPVAYSYIKGGIVSFTKYMASYYGKYNIRVNCISPGGIYNKQPRTFVNRYAKKTPLRRMGEKEDAVGAVLFLASNASEYVTGHNLVVDGGWSVV